MAGCRRKIIGYIEPKKEGREYCQDYDNSLSITTRLPEDLKNFIFNISSRPYFLKEKSEKLVTNIDIKICLEDTIHDKNLQVGEALAFYIKGEFSLQCGSLYQVMSTHGETLKEVYSALFMEGNQTVNRLDKYGAFGTNMLFIDYLCLLPEYRGYGLGRPILMGIIEEISCGAEVVIIEPVPIRFKDEDKNTKLRLPILNDEDYESVRKKLWDYWKPLGFIPVEGSNRFQILPLNIMHPSVNELLNEIFK